MAWEVFGARNGAVERVLGAFRFAGDPAFSTDSDRQEILASYPTFDGYGGGRFLEGAFRAEPDGLTSGR
jgi:hypothetical protein